MPGALWVHRWGHMAGRVEKARGHRLRPSAAVREKSTLSSRLKSSIIPLLPCKLKDLRLPQKNPLQVLKVSVLLLQIRLVSAVPEKGRCPLKHCHFSHGKIGKQHFLFPGGTVPLSESPTREAKLLELTSIPSTSTSKGKEDFP